MPSSISVNSLSPKFKKYENKIKKTASAVLKFLKKDNSSLAVFLIEDSLIKSLNQKFRKKNKPTNILSFQEPDIFPHPEMEKNGLKCLGEVFLAPAYIEKRDENISFLLIHGLLHLLDYTHSGKSDKILMERKEREVLANISVPRKRYARNNNRP